MTGPRPWQLLPLCVLLLTGCREDEQGRALDYEPGVYQGGPMPVIEEATRRDLRDRLSGQDF